MIADLEPYPAMKESGIRGIAEIPEHWGVQRAKYVLQPVDVRSVSGAEELLTVSARYGVVPRANQDVTMFKAASYVGHKLCWPGDLVINSLWAWANGLGFSNHHGIVSTAYGVYRPIAKHQVSGSYLNEALRSGAYQWQFQVRSKGIWKSRLQLTDWSFLEMPLVLPPAPEQAAIARYVDHVDRRVRRLVRAKRKLIELLTEQKQAIIHHAVTCGIEPDVPLKESGREWLGQIPEHWNLRRSKFTFRPRQELARPDDIQLSATQAYGVIPQAEYERRVGRKVVRVLRHLDKRRHVEVDDFVISMRSFQGGLERAWSNGAIRSSYIVLQPDVSLDVGYFGFLFKSRAYIGALQSTADFIRDGQDLNFDNFSAVDLPFPPVEEQRRISATLTPELAQLVEATERAELEIALINEYRDRLIADVVTGKLNVAEAAAALPDVDPLAAGDDLDDALDPDFEDELDGILEEAEA
ncbi:MAG: restriction endonuclease subunit S [bacterium]|nr:restriction endonuclease subunit S [bacterium]